MDRGGGRVEADTVREPSVLVRVVGEDQRDPALGRGSGAQGRPVGGEAGDEIDPVALGAVGGDGALGGVVVVGLALEADRAGQDAPVHLGQGHIHRDVAGGEAVETLGPSFLGTGGEDDLKHRGGVGGLHRQRIFRAVVACMRAADGKRGGVQDDAGRGLGKQVFEGRGRDRVFERGDEDGERVQALAQERLDHAVDRVETCALHQCPVEDEGDDGRLRHPHLADGGEVRDARAGPVDSRTQERAGGGRFLAPVEHRAGIGEEVGRVLRPALDEIGPERGVVFIGHRGERGEFGVGLVVAGKKRERHARLGHVGRVLLGPVAPVAGAAEHSGDHQTGLLRAGVDVQVHRHRVIEMREVREPQGGRGVHFRARLGKGGKLGIGGGDEHHVGRRLAQIDGILAIVDLAGGRGEEVHQSRTLVMKRLIPSSS